MRILCLLLLFGCGRIAFDPTSDANDTQSRTRLKSVWNELEGGLREFSGIYDSQRDEQCVLDDLIHDPETTRCLPLHHNVVYLDPGCTQPAVRRPITCVDTHYAQDADTRQLYEVGAELPGVTMFYGGDGTGTCLGPYNAIENLRAIGAPVAAEEFVELHLVQDTAGTRIHPRFYDAADGFRTDATLYDSEIDSGCTLGDAAGGRGCKLDNAFYALYFVDGGCTQALAQVPPGFRTTFGAYRSQTGCPVTAFEFARITTPIVPSAIYSYAGAFGCLSVTPPMNSEYLQLGPPLPIASFTSSTVTTGQRISRIVDAGSGLEIRTGWFDTVIDSACKLGAADDGVTRCLPDRVASIASFFSDAGCTVPIELAFADIFNSCTVDAPLFAADYVSAGCTSTLHFRELAAPYMGVVFQMVGTCSPRTASPGVTTTYWQVGADVPAETFVGATLVTDP